MKSPWSKSPKPTTHKNTQTHPSLIPLNQYKESKKYKKKSTITHSYNRIIANNKKKTLQNRTLIERPPERSLLGGSLDW